VFCPTFWQDLGEGKPGTLLVIGVTYFERVVNLIFRYLCVSLSFPFIYTDCLVCSVGISKWMRVLWFVPFIMIFQFGWAAVQIAHLALIPELSTDAGKRGSMNSGRNAFTVLANLTIYISFYCLLRRSKESEMHPDDLIYFQVNYSISLIYASFLIFRLSALEQLSLDFWLLQFSTFLSKNLKLLCASELLQLLPKLVTSFK
jgi:Na+/melibiose symporter-like transporter